LNDRALAQDKLFELEQLARDSLSGRANRVQIVPVTSSIVSRPLRLGPVFPCGAAALSEPIAPRLRFRPPPFGEQPNDLLVAETRPHFLPVDALENLDLAPSDHVGQTRGDICSVEAVRLAVENFAYVRSTENSERDGELDGGIKQPMTYVDQEMNCPIMAAFALRRLTYRDLDPRPTIIQRNVCEA
jgi:hypothetical protein